MSRLIHHLWFRLQRYSFRINRFRELLPCQGSAGSRMATETQLTAARTAHALLGDPDPEPTLQHICD